MSFGSRVFSAEYQRLQDALNVSPNLKYIRRSFFIRALKGSHHAGMSYHLHSPDLTGTFAKVRQSSLTRGSVVSIPTRRRDGQFGRFT
jgi:hypothetical protein